VKTNPETTCAYICVLNKFFFSSVVVLLLQRHRQSNVWHSLLFVVAEIQNAHCKTSLVNEMPNQELFLCTGHALATKKDKELQLVEVSVMWLYQQLYGNFWPNSNHQQATVLSISHRCDFMLFQRFEIGLRGHNFLSEEESQQIVKVGLTSIQKENFLRCFHQWQGCRNKCSYECVAGWQLGVYRCWFLVQVLGTSWSTNLDAYTCVQSNKCTWSGPLLNYMWYSQKLCSCLTSDCVWKIELCKLVCPNRQ